MIESVKKITESVCSKTANLKIFFFTSPLRNFNGKGSEKKKKFPQIATIPKLFILYSIRTDSENHQNHGWPLLRVDHEQSLRVAAITGKSKFKYNFATAYSSEIFLQIELEKN